MKRCLITGSSGLIGSEVALYFHSHGFEIHGIDNNQRAVFFGPAGDTRWNQQRLTEAIPGFQHHEADIRDRQLMIDLVARVRPDVIVHAAAQPSHDLAAAIPFDDFDTNAGGTLNMLEAARRSCPESPFIYMSTNKVYGDSPNNLPLLESEDRWDFQWWPDGISEHCPIDRSLHSIFGASKVAADVMVQEYGRYFGMPTCCLRGGCLTGPNHSGVEMHGFLSYLVKCNVEGRPYVIFGHKGKQVRDNIHAIDVARFIFRFYQLPRAGEVYNIGGGVLNSCSVLEAIKLVEKHSGQAQVYTYDSRARIGDHICYYSDLDKAKKHYPGWNVSIPLNSIIEEMVASQVFHKKAHD
jgi:CDP-paratose 2-epimerase